MHSSRYSQRVISSFVLEINLLVLDKELDGLFKITITWLFPSTCSSRSLKFILLFGTELKYPIQCTEQHSGYKATM